MCPLLSLGEEEISFPPTYRYERGSRDTYAWHKQKPTGVSEKYRLGDPSLCFPGVRRWDVKGLGLSITTSAYGFPEAFGGDVGYFGNPRKKAGAGFSNRRGVGFCQLWEGPMLQFLADKANHIATPVTGPDQCAFVV